MRKVGAFALVTYLWPEGKTPHFQEHQIAATVAEMKAGFNK